MTTIFDLTVDLREEQRAQLLSLLGYENASDLEIKSQKVGLYTLIDLVKAAKKENLQRHEISRLCAAFDLKALGEQATEMNSSLKAVMMFLKAANQAGIKADRLLDFCRPLNWRMFGEFVASDRFDNRISDLYFVHSLHSCKGMTPRIAKEFIEGIGWQNIHKAFTGILTPAGTSVLWLFLRQTCKYKPKQIRELAQLNSENSIWFHSFTTKVCSKSREKIHRYYLKFAFTNLLHDDIFLKLEQSISTLGEWAIFSYNISIVRPDYFQDKVAPVLRKYDKSHFEELLRNSELKDIAAFMRHFNPYDGIFDWDMPKDIDFQVINFRSLLQQSTLTDMAHFIFNFHYIYETHWCNFFALELDKCTAEVLAGITKSDLKALDFLLWNWWLCYPEDGFPSTFEARPFRKAILNRLREHKSDETNALGIIGTLHLSGCKISKKLINEMDPKGALKACRLAAPARNSKLMRLVAGLIEVSPGKNTEWIKKQALPIIFKLKFPMIIEKNRMVLDILRRFQANP